VSKTRWYGDDKFNLESESYLITLALIPSLRGRGMKLGQLAENGVHAQIPEEEK
jgi:hypothetical protein